MSVNEPTAEEIFQSELKSELSKWDVMGVMIRDWRPSNGFIDIMIRMNVLNEILEEAGILKTEGDEMVEKMQRHTLKTLSEIREALEPQIAEMRLNAIRANGIIKPPGMH